MKGLNNGFALGANGYLNATFNYTGIEVIPIAPVSLVPASTAVARLLMAVELHRRFADQGLTACYLHPETMVTTDIGRDFSFIRFAMLLVRPFTKTANQGAATSVFCATWDERNDLGGNYFSHCSKARPIAETANAKAATRLWELSENWLQEKGFGGLP